MIDTFPLEMLGDYSLAIEDGHLLLMKSISPPLVGYKNFYDMKNLSGII